MQMFNRSKKSSSQPKGGRQPEDLLDVAYYDRRVPIYDNATGQPLYNYRNGLPLYDPATNQQMYDHNDSPLYGPPSTQAQPQPRSQPPTQARPQPRPQPPTQARPRKRTFSAKVLWSLIIVVVSLVLLFLGTGKINQATNGEPSHSNAYYEVLGEGGTSYVSAYQDSQGHLILVDDVGGTSKSYTFGGTISDPNVPPTIDSGWVITKDHRILHALRINYGGNLIGIVSLNAAFRLFSGGTWVLVADGNGPQMRPLKDGEAFLTQEPTLVSR